MRKVQTWREKNAEGRKECEREIPAGSLFNKRSHYPPMFSPPSPKRNPYKSVLNRDNERRYVDGKRRQEQQRRDMPRPEARSQEENRVKYDPKERKITIKMRKVQQGIDLDNREMMRWRREIN